MSKRTARNCFAHLQSAEHAVASRGPGKPDIQQCGERPLLLTGLHVVVLTSHLLVSGVQLIQAKLLEQATSQEQASAVGWRESRAVSD
jgi:hypothetical protein